MSLLRSILSAPARAAGAVMGAANAVSELAIGTDLDFLELEDIAKAIAEAIEDDE